MDQLKQFLQSIADISAQEFEESKPFFTALKLKKGDFFVKQHQICQQVGFIVQGILRIYYLNEKGQEMSTCFCTENQMVTAYKSFLFQEPSQQVIEALTDCQLLLISYQDLQHLYAKLPVWQTIGRLLAEREYMLIEQYVKVLNNESAKEKYLRLLKEQPNVIQTATVEQIASYLGITRRTLSRIRKEITTEI